MYMSPTCYKLVLFIVLQEAGWQQIKRTNILVWQGDIIMNLGKMFLVIGVIFIIIGLLWSLIGKLPGDLVIKRGNITFYFPIVTSIVLSIILSLIFLLINKFR